MKRFDAAQDRLDEFYELHSDYLVEGYYMPAEASARSWSTEVIQLRPEDPLPTSRRHCGPRSCSICHVFGHNARGCSRRRRAA